MSHVNRAGGGVGKPLQTPPSLAEAKVVGGRRGGGGLFGRLLTDVTNEIKIENDEKVAVKMQDDDASSLMNEWMQEVRDKQVAAKLSERLEAEAKDRYMRDEHEGETAAMRLAVEERKRVQSEAVAKKQMEEKDSYMAKQAYDEEKHMIDQCEQDDALARELYDADIAEQLQKAEELRAQAEKKRYDELASADEKLAYAAQHDLEEELRQQAAKQEEEDRAVAQRLMAEDNVLIRTEREQQMKQEMEDGKLSKKMSIANLRAEHRRQKYLKMVVNAPYASGINVPTTAEMWRDADPVIEDVAGGICITILLPNIKKVDVKLSKKHVVVVEATRMVLSDEDAACIAARKKPEHTSYDIDFEIEGMTAHRLLICLFVFRIPIHPSFHPYVSFLFLIYVSLTFLPPHFYFVTCAKGYPVKITQSDLHYEYSSENGMLHVYVENVHLEGENDGSKSTAQAGSVMVKGLGVIRNVQEKFSKLISFRKRSECETEQSTANNEQSI